MKVRKSAGGSWKTFFAIGKPAGSGRRKPMRISSLFQPTTSHAGCRVDSVTLRSAKSEESLSSQHSGAGQCKLQRLRRPRSSSDGLALAASLDPQLLPPSRSYDSLLPEEAADRPEEQGEEEEEDDEEEEDEEGVYMLPDFSHDPAAAWMAEDVIDFSPTFLEDGPIGASGGRESPPPATPPPYRCVGHQGHAHSRSHSQRSVTEDPDSVLNQSEAAARRSLILAAAAPPVQVYCQHRPPEPTSPAHGPAPGPGPSPQAPPERRSFTRKVVHALSPKAPKSPPLDISDPIAISVPAKVLEMIGGRAGELQPGTQGAGLSQPPQMISMLLRSCDFQLTESCQQEIRSKLGPDPKVKGFMVPAGPSLPSQQPPPPPPKNPARLMALALAESANKALRQGTSPPYRPPQPRASPPEPLEARFLRAVSVDAGEVLSGSSPADPNQLYSTVRPLSVWMAEGEGSANAANANAPDTGAQQGGRSPVQDTGTLSSETSVSDSGGSHSEVTASSSSGDTGSAPSPVYKNQEEPPSPPAGKPAERESPAQRKPPAYSRQFSAPHLQQKGAPQSKSPPQPHPQLLHSKSECSPLAQVRAFQPTRPKVPPKPLELAPAARGPLSRTGDNYMRRSLDAARIRRIISQSQGGSPNPPLSRAFSERLSATSGYRGGRPHPAPQPSHIRPVPTSCSADDQGKGENFYYEISGPEQPQAPPSYAWHSYQNMRLEAEGNYRPGPGETGQRPLSRGHPHPHPLHPAAMIPRAPQLWSSEATRAWAAAHSHSHSHSFSHSHSHSHSHPHRHAASSVRLPRSEMHPAVMGSAPTPSALPLSVHKPQQRGASHRSPSADLASSQLHPYFENGKVCYRYFEASRLAEDQAHALRPSGHPLHPHHKPSSSSPPPPPPPKQPAPSRPQDRPEPVYVNFPFTSPPAAAKAWLTTDLDGHAQPPSQPPAPPPEPPPEARLPSPLLDEEERPPGPESAGYEGPPCAAAKDALVAAATSPPAPALAHYRSRSDPQSSSTEPGLTGKDIASLLIDKLAEDEGEDGPCAVTSSSTSSSPPLEHPPNPYPSQHQPAYNVYTPGPSRQAGSFHRPDPLRRSSSSGGQYRQAFDVMPSGDQVLKFYRPQDFAPGFLGENPNPYPGRPLYQDPAYPNRSPQDPHPNFSPPPPLDAPRGPSAALSHVMLGTPRGYGGHAGGFQMAPPPQYSQYQFQSVPVLSQYPNTPRREGTDPSLRPPPLQNQRGLTRQGSLPGPNWTIHTEGQTRSYC